MKGSKKKSTQKKKNSWQQINTKREKRDNSIIGSMNSKNESCGRNQVHSKPISIPTSASGDGNWNGRSTNPLLRQRNMQQHNCIPDPRYRDSPNFSPMRTLGRSASPTSSNVYSPGANRSRGFIGYGVSPKKHSLSPSSGPLCTTANFLGVAHLCPCIHLCHIWAGAIKTGLHRLHGAMRPHPINQSPHLQKISHHSRPLQA